MSKMREGRGTVDAQPRYAKEGGREKEKRQGKACQKRGDRQGWRGGEGERRSIIAPPSSYLSPHPCRTGATRYKEEKEKQDKKGKERTERGGG
mmetsp:Transcript_42250/g.108801  ORF Transcript_42250/g.108801 Transcript_42250/m.108801 type:complete len:93 (-) Transcript_42250:69-347(-)